MVLFGIPQVHEYDAVRAIKAVQELHAFVKSLGPQFESKIGRPIAMHSGISTGLVVAYEIKNEAESDSEKSET